MAKIEITVDDADLAAVDAVWQSRGYADLAARLQEFADDEVHAAKISANQTDLVQAQTEKADEEAKPSPDGAVVAALDAEIATVLKADYDLRLSRDAATKEAAAVRDAVLAAAAAVEP